MGLFDVKVTTTKAFSTERLVKYINNGIAIGLTKTAKEAQEAVLTELGSHFTVRNKWATNSPIGIKIKAASGDKPSEGAEVFTKAPFGQRQQEGGTKIPYGNHIAVPAKAGPLNRARVIPAGMRPKALIDSGRGFIVTLNSGKKAIALHDKRKRDFVIVYFLEPSVKVKATDWFYGPVQKVARERLAKNVGEGIDTTLARFKASTSG
jgi:hypothetical protein